MGATLEDMEKLIISKFPKRPCFGPPKKVRACVIFFGLLNFVCYLPFGLVMKKLLSKTAEGSYTYM